MGFPKTFEQWLDIYYGGSIRGLLFKYKKEKTDLENIYDKLNIELVFNSFIDLVNNKYGEDFIEENGYYLDFFFNNDLNYKDNRTNRKYHKELKKLKDLAIEENVYNYLEKEFYKWKNLKYQKWVFPKRVYRALDLKESIRSIEDIINLNLKERYYSGLGVYWAVEERYAKAYWGRTYNNIYVLRATIEESAVDWNNTIFINLDWEVGREEQELRLKKGAYLFDVAIKKKGDNRWYSLKGFNIRADINGIS